MKKLTHVDENGKALMVDVGGKKVVARYACAGGSITLNGETIELIRHNLVKKGDVLAVAEIAGIMAAKRTSGLIPLCHNITLDQVIVRAALSETGASVVSEVRCTGSTGAEMEALTAVSVALLTIYDMCKATDKGMVISEVRLVEKSKSEIANP
jgi:cyclic pyranopterin monophosphate synthase